MPVADDIIDVRQLDQIRFSFTALGQAIQEVSKSNEDLSGFVKDSLSEMLSKFSEGSTRAEDLKKASRSVGVSDSYVNNVSESLNKVSKSFASTSKKVDGTLNDANGQFTRLIRESAAILREYEAIKKKEESQKPGAFGKVAMKGLDQIKGGVNSVLSMFHLPTFGNILGGIVGIMAYGYKDAKRVEAEAGELTNILVASFNSGVKGAVGGATRTLSRLQENLQTYLGINRQGIQSVTTAFVEGGLSIEQMLAGVDEKIKWANAGVIGVTYALDRLFELADGTSAKRMVGFMEDYGKTVKSAKDSLVALYMTGKDSGIGAMQFVKNVEDVSKSLVNLGINIDHVANIYNNVTQEFAKMGVPKQFAGRYAAEGMKQISGGISKLSDDWLAVIGAKVFAKEGAQGLEARQMLLDGFLNAQKEDKTNLLQRILKAMHEIAMNATGGNEDEARMFMEIQMGMGFEGTKVAFKIMELFNSGKMVEAAKVTEENMELLSESLNVEKTKNSEFERTMASFMKGLATLGQGLLGMAIRGIALIIAYVKALPAILSNLVSGNKQNNERIYAEIDKIVGTGEADKATAIAGLRRMASEAKKLAGDVLGASINTLVAAYNYNPRRGTSEAYADPGDHETGSADGAAGASGATKAEVDNVRKLIGATPMQQKAPPEAPAASGGGGGAPPTAKKGLGKALMSAAGGAAKGGPPSGGYIKSNMVGGQFELRSGGVSPDGSVVTVLSGSCPQCGYAVGDAASATFHSSVTGASVTAFDVISLARVIQTEAGGAVQTEEAKQIGWTVLNRAKRNKGKSISDLVTKGQGFGKQGKGSKRQYATGDEASPASIKLAMELLSGKHKDTTSGATSFQHLSTNMDMDIAFTNLQELNKNKKATVYRPSQLGNKDGAKQFVAYSEDKAAKPVVSNVELQNKWDPLHEQHKKYLAEKDKKKGKTKPAPK